MNYKTIDFSKYSSFKLGPKVDVALLEDIKDYSKEFYIIGGANNLLVSNNPPKLMMLSKKYDYIKLKDSILTIGGSTPTGKIASFCKKNNIADFEFLSHLPGKLGGVVYMNAGLKEYEIFNNLISIKTTSGVFFKDDIEFGYRFAKIDGAVLEASFKTNFGFSKDRVEMFKKMRLNQPKLPSAGSCFKNPPNDYAGRVIEEVGLKGFRVGDMEFSNLHANFLVNLGNGKFEDAMFLISQAKKRVFEKFKIELECEIDIL